MKAKHDGKGEAKGPMPAVSLEETWMRMHAGMSKQKHSDGGKGGAVDAPQDGVRPPEGHYEDDWLDRIETPQHLQKK